MRTLIMLGFFITATLVAHHPKKINKCMVTDRILNAIVMQETRNTNVNGDLHLVNDYSVGYAQVRISTARWMLKNRIHTRDLIGLVLRYLTSKRVRLSKLLKYRFVNMYFARNYLQFICSRKRGNFKQTIIAYNVGPWAKQSIIKSKGSVYFKGVMRFY